MPSLWPKTIGCGLGRGGAREWPEKTGFPQDEIAKGFWPPLSRGPNTVPGRRLRPRVHPRSADYSPANSRDAGLFGEGGWIIVMQVKEIGSGASQWQKRQTAGGHAPPGDRRGASVAAGSLGQVSHGPAGDCPGNGTSWHRLRFADGGVGSDDASRSSDGWRSAAHSHAGGCLRVVEKRCW